MNRIVIASVLFLGFFLIFSAPLTSFAEQRTGQYYITVKPGVYIPTGDLNHKGFDNSFNGELTVGTYYMRNLALEASLGYFRTEASARGADFNEEDDLWVIPVTVTFKGVLPLEPVELFAGGGGGIYFAHINAGGSTSTGSFSRDDSATVGGAYIVAGGNVDISRKIFLGAEGKYLVTTTAKMLGGKVHLNGFMVTGVLGYRFQVPSEVIERKMQETPESLNASTQAIMENETLEEY